MLKQYGQDVMPGGALNQELEPINQRAKYMAGALDPNSQISQDLQGWHRRTQRGLADQLAGRETQDAKYAYDQLMKMSGPANLGITVWHGTPHKFAPTAKNPLGEFDLGKIGTGEGAQAYGHGVYVAEAKDVADEYAGKLSKPYIKFATGETSLDLSRLSEQAKDVALRMQKVAEQMQYGYRKEGAAKILWNAPESVQKELIGNAERWNAFSVPDSGSLYKVDLPDEHLSRFLDWDATLANQSAEVKKLLGIGEDQFSSFKVPASGTNYGFSPQQSASDFYNELAGIMKSQQSASAALSKQGLLGLRYLDQGSRSAATGTRNHVVFDPSILKILERQ